MFGIVAINCCWTVSVSPFVRGKQESRSFMTSAKQNLVQKSQKSRIFTCSHIFFNKTKLLDCAMLWRYWKCSNRMKVHTLRACNFNSNFANFNTRSKTKCICNVRRGNNKHHNTKVQVAVTVAVCNADSQNDCCRRSRGSHSELMFGRCYETA